MRYAQQRSQLCGAFSAVPQQPRCRHPQGAQPLYPEQSAMTAFALSVLSAYHLLPLPLQWLTLGKKTKTPQPPSNPSQISTDKDTGLNPQLLQMDPGHMGWSDTPAQLSAGKEAQKRFGGLKDILLPCPYGRAIS
ncbi:PREDICTED: uncharacterized protein LOC105536088 [Mandrillus leucophaeus]|uniref:uncharacterized protein LOC105536088 n=1 Tax=Mandrillus leucophaeus TaxID=9568 RepID=UPI0005F41B89|nr:PREDICTED: uncharacterized protein LOC105536088 [Mandrillus leucophaeus]